MQKTPAKYQSPHSTDSKVMSCSKFQVKTTSTASFIVSNKGKWLAWACFEGSIYIGFVERVIRIAPPLHKNCISKNNFIKIIQCIDEMQVLCKTQERRFFLSYLLVFQLRVISIFQLLARVIALRRLKIAFVCRYKNKLVWINKN